MSKSYSELVTLSTFEDRYNYLRMEGRVGEDIFGSNRYLNQAFYTSKEWKDARAKVIARDNALDLGIKDVGNTRLYIHHINPVTMDDLINHPEKLVDPENLITTTKATHNAIHYGSLDPLELKTFSERSKNDTCPWKQQ